MKETKFELVVIRNYHETLLRLARVLREYREMIGENDFMDIKWKCAVARGFARVEADAKEVTKKIRELRKEYKCLGY